MKNHSCVGWHSELSVIEHFRWLALGPDIHIYPTSTRAPWLFHIRGSIYPPAQVPMALGIPLGGDEESIT